MTAGRDEVQLPSTRTSTHSPALVTDTPLNGQNCIIRDCRERLEAGLFFGKGFIDNAQGRGTNARIGDLTAPGFKPGVQVVDIAECPCRKEVPANVAERPFNLTFRLGAIGPTRARHRAVMIEQNHQRRVAGDNTGLIFTMTAVFILS